MTPVEVSYLMVVVYSLLLFVSGLGIGSLLFDVVSHFKSERRINK
jgi:hypothetical protein